MANNPFTLMYGITARSVVSRDAEMERIYKSFVYEENMFAYLITGIRGTGKTVLLKAIEKKLSEAGGWVVVNINPQTDITSSLAKKLFDTEILRKELKKWKISLNLGAMTLTREGGEQTSDPEIMVEDFLARIKAHNLKVLISIDEVNDTQEFRRFINLFQILIGKGLPCYLLMTALKENVSGLINDKAMTFLTRTPKVELEPLSLANVAKEYEDVLEVSRKTAVEMAKLTNGYAFAFQVLGYLFVDMGKSDLTPDLLNAYDKYLWNNGYNKFWKDRTKNERLFLIALAESPTGGKEEILSHYKLNPSSYSVYRERLIEQGFIYMPSYGKLAFVLPRFSEFVEMVKEFE